MFRKRAVFLDRDGTLVKGVLHPDIGKQTAPFKLEEIQFDPNIDAAMQLIKDLGYLRIIVTNQPDVAYGHVTQEEWERIHRAIVARVQPDDCFMCRHPRADNCPFRKPSPHMLLAAADKWGIDLKRSFIVGDTEYDMGAGEAAGCVRILIDAPYNQQVQADHRVPGLSTAAYIISISK